MGTKDYTVTTDEKGIVKDFQFLPDGDQMFYESDKFIKSYSISTAYKTVGDIKNHWYTQYLEPNSRYILRVNTITKPFYQIIENIGKL